MAGMSACSSADKGPDSWPTYDGDDLELSVDANGTHFALWSPKADAARVYLYDADGGSAPIDSLEMDLADGGVWRASSQEQLYGKFYTFRICHEGQWLAETPGVWAKAVGTNGYRAAIVNLDETDPEGWSEDRGPKVDNIVDIVLYEMHHRDFSIHPSSGVENKGKFLALTETGTKNNHGQATGIDHLK